MSADREALLRSRCTPSAKALSDGEVEAILREFAQWTRDGGAIRRRFEFEDFHHTMAFVNAVAWIAHREDHHPDLDAGYDHCTVAWSTHSAGGLTRNDFICAAHTEALLAA